MLDDMNDRWNNHKSHGPVLPQNMLAQVSNEMVIGEKSKEFGK